ncbi:VOC family protein [Kribbella sp. NPDC050124]|uniref:VOC family protein n=1 Tax=Kribbella sp. NPDC050124 TaxID=3364114 RepID=UPI00379C4E30
MINLHHTHLMASDIDATITFWRDAFDAEVIYDTDFAGARIVFLRIGTGRIHVYDQPPKASAKAPSTTSASKPTNSSSSFNAC